ncbi:MAG TPA: head GIN domain-containing protein [Flavisolibacter sp.]|nr:head GIN domain-containing protein [Flavisolibacter sp.]
MRKISLAFVIVSSLLFVSCRKVTGDGPVVSETRPVPDFTGIDQRVGATVYYTQSPNYKVEVSAQQNILDVLQTYVSNNKLVVKFKDGVQVRSHESIRVEVAAPQVNSVHMSGSGNLYITGPFTPGSLDLAISGSGDMNITELNTGFLEAVISGSGNIRISKGSAGEEKLKISGSGNMNLENITAARVTTTTSGSGDTKVTATETLDVTISGSGSVYYNGSPRINASISGSGKVVHF